jgi:hypothetical protein
MHNVFLRLCQEFDLTFYKGAARNLPRAFDVFVPGNSEVCAERIPAPFKGLHLIRDPRDIVISGCFYHQKATEQWLRVKQDHFGGLSYQEKLKSYWSLDDQILFEMEHAAVPVVQEMLAWDYEDSSFFETKYEALISDEQLLLFHSIFAFLGFPGSVIPQALKIAFENSLFSGVPTITSHIRSGKPKQWQSYFKFHHKVRFIELFGDALQRLGYETSDEWANEEPRLIPITCTKDAWQPRRAA